MTDDKKEEVTQNVQEKPVDVVTQATEQAKELVKDLTPEQLHNIQVTSAMSKLGNWKTRLSGFPKFNKPVKPNRFWYNGKLINKEEHDKLSWKEIHASNNVIRKAK